jgi:hypothetical protein
MSGGYLGGDNNSPSFPDALDEIRIYNRILSPAEVQILYEQSIMNPITQNPPNISDGLIAYWSFNEGGGNIVRDYSNDSGQNNITLDGQTFAAGTDGSALKFNGNLLSIPTLSLGGNINTFSLSFWIKTTITGPNGLFNFGQTNCNCFYFEIGNNGTGIPGSIYFWCGCVNTFLNSTIAINDNNWHHIVATVYSDGVTPSILYIDGIANYSRVIGPLTTMSGGHLGGDNNSPSFPDALDEIRIYNRILSPAEVQKLYEN